jgi:hypothetical protein
MKTYLTYGFVMALAGAFLTLVLFFLGFHSDAAKLQTANWIALPLVIVITVACIVLGTKARRAELPASQNFGYGSALGAGVMITLVGAVLGVVTNYLYSHMINTGYNELIVQAQIAKWEAAGMSSAQVERAEGMMRKMMSPALQAAFGLLMVMFWGTLISLITAAFLKRPAADAPPVAG